MRDGEASFHHHVPRPPLDAYVAFAHGYRVPAMPTGRHRGLPSRHLTLVLDLGAPLQVIGSRGAVAAHAVLGGLDVHPALIDASRPQEGLQYALNPLGARVLLGVPAGELSGQVLDLSDVLGRRADTLVEQLAAAADWSERFRRVDAALLERLSSRVGQAPPEVARAWSLVLASGGRASVRELAAEVGWSRRHLSERFRVATGVTPKQASRIARFERARHLLLAPSRLPLADVAVTCGYADQPHLAREWRALAGCSIGTWLREELPFVQDVEA